MVQYSFDVLRAVSPSTLLRTLRFSKGQVEPVTMNADPNADARQKPFALRYRRVNAIFYERINRDIEHIVGLCIPRLKNKQDLRMVRGGLKNGELKNCGIDELRNLGIKELWNWGIED